MRQLLWIGCLESDEEFKMKASKGYDLSSAQVSQKNLLLGIEHVSGKSIDSINGSVLPPYPIYKDRNIETVIWFRNGVSYNISVGYKNDKYINRINCKRAMINAGKKWCRKRYQGDELVIFVYSMRSAPMTVAYKIKKRVPNTKIYLIVTDLPQFMDLNQDRLKAFLKKIDWYFIQKKISKFDGFILYAEKMASFLKITSDKFIVMEGCYEATENTEKNLIRKKSIMYSGKLDIKYGINMLLDAFMQIPDDELELWISGGGNAEKYIRKCACKDKRIKFLGFLPNRKDILKKQQEATLLINMRLPSEPASDYCFPSKLLEYMATGIPVLSFKLGGIPPTYYPYLLLIEDETVSSIRQAITNALQLSDATRNQIGSNAQEYIRNNKTSDKQAARILSWIYKEHFVCQKE